jgi:Uma2 family endonuclease
MPAELLAPPADLAKRRRRVVDYPEGDGKPMAESDAHISQLINAREIIKHWLREAAMAYVGANMLLYYQEGNPKKRVAPDVYVVWGVGKKYRRSYKLWEEKQAPQVVFEFTSRKTQEEDLGTKRLIYSRIGVEEYYLFDPYGHYLNPPLRGYQLVGEEYVLRTTETLLPPAFNGKETKQGWRLVSERLKLDLWAFSTGRSDMPYELRFYDPAEGKWLVDPAQAMVEREAFAKQAREAQAELARLKAELEKLRDKK